MAGEKKAMTEGPKQIDGPDPWIYANTISELLANHEENYTHLVEFDIIHFFPPPSDSVL